MRSLLKKKLKDMIHLLVYSLGVFTAVLFGVAVGMFRLYKELKELKGLKNTVDNIESSSNKRDDDIENLIGREINHLEDKLKGDLEKEVVNLNKVIDSRFDKFENRLIKS